MYRVCVNSDVLMTAGVEGTPGWDAFHVAFSRSYRQQHLLYPSGNHLTEVPGLDPRGWCSGFTRVSSLKEARRRRGSGASAHRQLCVLKSERRRQLQAAHDLAFW